MTTTLTDIAADIRRVSKDALPKSVALLSATIGNSTAEYLAYIEGSTP